MSRKFGWGAARGDGLLHHAPSRIVPQHGRGKEQGINSVKHAAVAGKKRPGIFYPGAALDQRFHQIAQLGRDIDDARKAAKIGHSGAFSRANSPSFLSIRWAFSSAELMGSAYL